MGHTYRLEQQRHLIHLPHLVVQMLTIGIQDDDEIVNVVTVREVAEAAMAVEAVKVVGAEKIVGAEEVHQYHHPLDLQLRWN